MFSIGLDLKRFAPAMKSFFAVVLDIGVEPSVVPRILNVAIAPDQRLERLLEAPAIRLATVPE
jgi:hypothetical protein